MKDISGQMRGIRWLFLLAGMLIVLPANATHNRAGEITCKQISDFTYEVTVTTFTYTLSMADRPQLEVQWGDNTTSIVNRVGKVELPNYYRRNTYIARHTYPGPGVYKIVVQDPNRNFGVKNIPNSVNVIFSIQTVLMINPALGQNSTPILLNPPFDKAAIGHIFIHNPTAYDPDGDSLSYSLTICRKENGEPIEGYTFPPASDTLYVNPVTGDLVWDSPVDSGIFNVAINISEWRDGVKIGNIERDMQVNVYTTDNHAPQNQPVPDMCVMAGDSISVEVTSTDVDMDSVYQYAFGGPFVVEDHKAAFTRVAADTGFSRSLFTWQTTCMHVRKQPYQVVIKSWDNNAQLSLVDMTNFHIRVLGPPPENLRLRSSSNFIRVSWSPGVCDTAVIGYRIYRKTGYSGYTPDSCVAGIPPEVGYKLVGKTNAPTDTFFIDDNNGQGLQQGTDYCYMVVGVYPDNSESVPSEEVCGTLIQGTPVLIHVSVLETDPVEGKIFVSWAKPTHLDTIPANGPYEYKIYRSTGIWGEDFKEIFSFTTADLNDTTFIDSLFNTKDFAYTYRVELYNDEPGNRFLIGTPDEASSVFLYPEPNDRRITLHIRKNVPWINKTYVVYRQNKNTMQFDSVGVTSDSLFTDAGLINGEEYCYRVISYGAYNKSGLPDPIVNVSHDNCGVPVDLTPPCPPDLTVISFCDSLYNQLMWTNPQHTCGDDDVAYYTVYYKSTIDGELQKLTDIQDPNDTSFLHFPESSMAGCYAVSATDKVGNVSDLSAVVCVDNCSYYEIPNVFTPNGDNINDILRAKTHRFVERVNMQIYNRYGMLVYQTDDPLIKWDGKYMGKNTLVPPGVYYYLCDVYEKRLTGTEVRNITGFIHVITEKGAKVSTETIGK
ncbi:MAG TPA: T9SS type B sorting domain-containing protein [Bacteroidetes bacterium]|nr:T9SS type B sorting domain-containing protein [Bacteroidota bacterium]